MRGHKRKQAGEEPQGAAKLLKQVLAVPGPGTAGGGQHAAAAQDEMVVSQVQHALHVKS